MGINWGGGAQGAASGAAMGAMAGGPWGAAAGGVLGGAMGMFGGSGGQMQQVNPYAAKYWDMMKAEMARAQAGQGRAENQQGAYLGAGANLYNQLGNFETTAQYDPQAALRSFNSQIPQMQNLARDSISAYGDAQGTAADRARRMGNDIAQKYQNSGMMNSGAAASAISEGAGRAAGEINLGQDQQFQQMLQGIYQRNMAAQMQSQQSMLQNAQTSDQMRFQGLGMNAQGLTGIGAQYGQRAAGYQNIAGGAMSGMGQVAGQEFMYTPPENQMLDALQYGAGLASNLSAAGVLKDKDPTSTLPETRPDIGWTTDTMQGYETPQMRSWQPPSNFYSNRQPQRYPLTNMSTFEWT